MKDQAWSTGDEIKVVLVDSKGEVNIAQMNFFSICWLRVILQKFSAQVCYFKLLHP
jgi:hypothetical protein